jgi:cell division protein FtsN
MNIEVNQIPAYLKKLLNKITRFLVPIYLCLLIGVIGFLVFKINQFSNLEPDPEQVANQQNVIKRVTIDQEAIDKIQNLEEQNVGVKSLFKQARENPFSDN